MSLNSVPMNGEVISLTRNRVLRNTYLLLAISMLPTIAGAALGVRLGFSFFAGSPLIGFLLFMGIAFGFFFAIEKFKNSSVGVALLLGFTFFMGLMLSRILQVMLGFSNGASLIALAAGGTGVIFFAMASIATVTKRDLSGMGKFLFVGMILALIAGVANIFLQLPVLSIVMSVVFLGIFSAYILYDVNRVVSGGETNYISATLAIYLDIYNVFVSLLQLLGIFGGERD
ncbi:Bax inhibitor-1/YccA family protein [Niveibacterium umoris]|uniref:Modulator of FtsH protease n=1 Tax=Niveibacterium umoris TaxID=1193620 RepID=A0A840BH29_9RHOO|nr:Bax inhibitor-1/YccA family protein [Niveibacterium umoris]MBB4011963.1 modulator of FtsH protease [Niveibacterium umoris]